MFFFCAGFYRVLFDLFSDQSDRMLILVAGKMLLKEYFLDTHLTPSPCAFVVLHILAGFCDKIHSCRHHASSIKTDLKNCIKLNP